MTAAIHSFFKCKVERSDPKLLGLGIFLRKAATGFVLLIALSLLSFAASAQVIDQIEIQPNSNGAQEIVLRFFPDVKFVQASPEQKARTIRIYFLISGNLKPFSALTHEFLTGPRVEGIPNFTVSFPEPDSSLLVSFPSAVDFKVRQIRGARTISLFVKKTTASSGQNKHLEEPMRPAISAAPGPAQLPAPPVAGASLREKVAPPVSMAASAVIPGSREPKGASDVALKMDRYMQSGAHPVTATRAASGEKPHMASAALTSSSERKPVPGMPNVILKIETALNNSTSAPPKPLSKPPLAGLAQSPPPGAITPTPSATVPLSSTDLAGLEPPDDFAPVPLAQVETVSKDLLEKARLAIAGNDAAGAIKHLNHLLNLPTSASSREAQELMGIAREKNNEIAKAKSEYELFLRLYPTGADSKRVTERLAKLPAIIEPPAQIIAGGPSGKPAEPGWVVTGGLSQYHYSGNSHIEILTPPPPGLLTFNQQTLSLTDQNALVTNLDAMAMHRSGTTDTRLVLRDSYTLNSLPNQTNQSRLSAAYVEQSDQKAGYQYRLGRQSGTYGYIGMFDGAFGAYQISPEYRGSVSAGQISQYVSSPIKQTFWGVGIEKLARPQLPGGTLYFVQQSADGYLDRQAVGLELRYFDANKSGFSTVDYDLAFHELNLVMVQGNYRFDGGANIFILTDHRKSPMLQLLNALPAAMSPAPGFLPATNISTALLNTGLSVDELRQWAADVTAKSHMSSAGVMYPLTPKWQVGADVGITSMSSLAGAGSVPAQAGSGISTSYNYQLIGSGILMEGDTGVLNTNVIDSPTYKGRNSNINIGSSLFDYKVRIDLGFRYYQQWDKNSSGTMNRYSPTLRFNYRVSKDVNLEAESGIEKSQQTDAGNTNTNSTRKYLNMGYRWNWL